MLRSGISTCIDGYSTNLVLFGVQVFLVSRLDQFRNSTPGRVFNKSSLAKGFSNQASVVRNNRMKELKTQALAEHVAIVDVEARR